MRKQEISMDIQMSMSPFKRKDLRNNKLLSTICGVLFIIYAFGLICTNILSTIMGLMYHFNGASIAHLLLYSLVNIAVDIILIAIGIILFVKPVNIFPASALFLLLLLVAMMNLLPPILEVIRLYALYHQGFDIISETFTDNYSIALLLLPVFSSLLSTLSIILLIAALLFAKAKKMLCIASLVTLSIFMILTLIIIAINIYSISTSIMANLPVSFIVNRFMNLLTSVSNSFMFIICFICLNLTVAFTFKKKKLG